MVLDEYYKASSYAIAATVQEANMYKHEYEIGLIKAIAEKCGAQISTNSNNSNPAKFNNKTFLNKKTNNSSNANSMIPKEYESSTFDDIASSMV